MFRTWGRVSLFTLLACFCLVTVAAEKKSTSTKASSKSSKATSSKAAEDKEPQLTGRLPRFFASLVDDKQRQEIYEIQASYREEIEELEAALAKLEEEQMDDIEKVLTTTQRKKLADMREDAESSSAKSTAKSSTSKSTSSKSTSAKPASTKSSSTSKKTSSRSKK